MVYSGVVTTGIYCRPGCPAQPKADNVRSYLFPAGAEAAGFRPCLRCRPDRSGPVPAWTAPSEVVCRALHLIEDGALDGATTDVLASRLGVSGRHLRRLFDDHVGASPDAVARSRRSHFARRLLDETDLRVADIAFASGFQSLRQMNRVVAETFRFTPTELRRRRRAGDLLLGPGLGVRVPFREPLAFQELLRFFEARAVPGVEHADPAAGVYRRYLLVDGAAGHVEVSRDTAPGQLVVEAHLPSYRGLIHVVERVRRLFDLGCDPTAVDGHLSGDPRLAGIVGTTPGRRVPGCWDSFEVLVRAVVGQQVSVAGATTLVSRIVDRFGATAATDDGTPARALPSPEVLAEADTTGCGLTRARAATLRSIATAVADGTLDPDAPATADDLQDRLTALPGVGPWTAAYVAMRLGHPDAFPASDLGIRKGAATLGLRDLDAAAEAWRPWRSYAALHLWSTLDPSVRIRPEAQPVSA